MAGNQGQQMMPPSRGSKFGSSGYILTATFGYTWTSKVPTVTAFRPFVLCCYKCQNFRYFGLALSFGRLFWKAFRREGVPRLGSRSSDTTGKAKTSARSARILCSLPDDCQGATVIVDKPGLPRRLAEPSHNLKLQ